MKKKRLTPGEIIDRVDRFCRAEGWQVERVSYEGVKVVVPTASMNLTLMITPLKGGKLQIAATIERPLPMRQQVLQNVLPDSNVTLSPNGYPTRTTTIRIVTAKLDEFTIDEMLVGAMAGIDALFKP